jgi:hypothetical protein
MPHHYVDPVTCASRHNLVLGAGTVVLCDINRYPDFPLPVNVVCEPFTVLLAKEKHAD